MLYNRQCKRHLPDAAWQMVSTTGSALGDLGDLVAAGRRQLGDDTHRHVVLAQRHAYKRQESVCPKHTVIESRHLVKS